MITREKWGLVYSGGGDDGGHGGKGDGDGDGIVSPGTREDRV